VLFCSLDLHHTRFRVSCSRRVGQVLPVPFRLRLPTPMYCRVVRCRSSTLAWWQTSSEHCHCRGWDDTAGLSDRRTAAAHCHVDYWRTTSARLTSIAYILLGYNIWSGVCVCVCVWTITFERNDLDLDVWRAASSWPYLCRSHSFLLAFIASTLLVGRQKKYLAYKNWVIRYWRGYLSGARCERFGCGAADATASPSSLASLKSTLVWPLWCRLTEVVLEKRPLNRCHIRRSRSLSNCTAT